MKTDLDTLLTLISTMIFADQRVYASEVMAFVKLTNELVAARGIDPDLSEAQLLTWYEYNKADIRARLVAPDFALWFHDLIVRLKDVADKPAILEVMNEISAADGEVHVNETALIQLVARGWNLAA